MIKYEIDSEQHLVRAKMSGSTTLDALVVHIANLSRDPQFDPSYNLLFEVTADASFSLLPIESELRQLMRQWTSRRKGTKWAFWTPFGTTHSHMHFAIELLDKTHVDMRLFDNEPAAVRWLKDGTLPPEEEK